MLKFRGEAEKMQTSILYLMCLLIISCSHGAAPRSNDSTGAMQQATEALSPEGLQQLHTIVDSGRLATLQWQNFSDYAIWVKQFYATDPVQLAWTSGGKPTKQALELAGILESAEQKGLESKDYDGERWPGRIGNVESGVSNREAELVKFDVALTVSGMRYISDLHLGRVDPKVLHRDFDPERHKYNLAEFLRQRVMTASSVEEALKGIEPPFPGYHRTIGVLQNYLQLAKEETPDPLPSVKKPIEPGQNYEALPKLAARLKFLGDMPVAANLAPDSTSYQGEIVEAVKRFQQRHGLESEGKLGPQTIVGIEPPDELPCSAIATDT